MKSETKRFCTRRQDGLFVLVDCVFENETKHTKATRGNCGAFAQLVPQTEPVIGPDSNEKDPVVLFGKRCGKRVGQLPRDYAQWGAKNLKDRKWSEIFKGQLQ